ncbi:transglutaminase domain-containing protein [Curtobacterium sp. MCSS17_015]|uniref:transglutaminase family protein n=1 Tax=Curtobacterium sp. MCSS17_015 TaxID=2175666 RepID=UPI000DA9FC42|nr:transglutaminase domain-containing protein [Curtobacterium sp. MCSS17_015]WIB25116.1 transglutaminaseTgpA domain-containing protein [Curtobacterium sp. MCSS17_015]
MSVDSGQRRPRGAARRDRPSPVRLVGGTLAVWLLLAVASVAWWPVYQDTSMVAAGVTALVVGSLVAVLGAVSRLPAAAVAVATVVGFAATGVPTAVPDEAAGLLPTGRGLVDLFAGVALAWRQLLTVDLPVGSYEALLVPYAVSVLLAAVTGVSVATRASRPELASLPALALFVAGVVVGPSRLETSVVLAVVLAGIALVWALTSRHVRRAVAVAGTTGARVPVGRAVVRPALVGTATIAVAAVVATGLGLVVTPSAARTVARTDVVKPFDPTTQVSPLSGFRAYQRSDEADRTQLTVSGLPAGGFVRVATLDTYDGVVYRVGGPDGAAASGSFERVPTSVDTRDVRGTRVRVDVRVSGYRGVWLPTVGDLEAVTFRGAAADEERSAFFLNRSTGTAALVDGVTGRTRYSLSAVLPDQPTEDELVDARPGDAAVPTPRSVPDAVRDVVRADTDDGTAPGAQLLAVLRALARDGYVSHGVGDDRPSRSGHGADRIEQLLTAQPMVGDQEQYAVAAALMAREIGFPARVVLGFTPGGDSGAPADTTVDDTTTFRGSDVTARIEVDTAQWGWVMLDPNPDVREIPDESEQTPEPVTRPETVVPPPPAEPQEQDQQTPPDADRETPPTQPLWLQVLLAVLPWALGVLGLSMVLLLPAAGIVLVKRLRRRRRRRAPDPRARVVGAWDEYRDALLDGGHDVVPTATRQEVASTAPGSDGAALAAGADAAVFGPADVDDQTAERTWAIADTAIVALGSGRDRRARFRAATSLRSLRSRRPAWSVPSRHAAEPAESASAGPPAAVGGRSERR